MVVVVAAGEEREVEGRRRGEDGGKSGGEWEGKVMRRNGVVGGRTEW